MTLTIEVIWQRYVTAVETLLQVAPFTSPHDALKPWAAKQDLSPVPPIPWQSYRPELAVPFYRNIHTKGES